MNLIFLILLSQFVFIHGFGPVSSSKDSNPNSLNVEAGTSHDPLIPLRRLKMEIMSENDELLLGYVNLKLTKRSLANENLPIWILKGVVDSNNLENKYTSDLVQNNKVMWKLGKFSIYQQPETSSALVYFHKRRQFDGMIGYEILIRRLPIEVINSEGETRRQIGKHGVYRQPNYQGHTNTRSYLPDQNAAGVNYQFYKKTYQGRLYDGYPEVLVIISWDVAKDWTKFITNKSNFYTTIVSEVITLFNGVDMLYSKLKETKIQINIAGIIIGTEKESFAFLEECYQVLTEAPKPIVKKLNAICINANIISYLKARQNKISRDSYDAVVFLTREKLFYIKSDDPLNHKNENFMSLQGLALYNRKLAEYKKRNVDVILPATITDDGYFQNYPTIAHELGHLMSVLHDNPPYFTDDGECCGYLLKTFSDTCNKCLSWSETSEKSFNFFYRSPNCCSFINEPRSLLPPRRHPMLTADQQCQCYGYEKALRFREFSENFCSTNLECIGSYGEVQLAAIPMDGTPHGLDDKVCWDEMSQVTQIFKSILVINV
ncbi:hypothetical protein PV327_010267 [Microctonus hyperodae]|uniref:Peptidase M12B domain-containing protein n=1 Tax=Microctonus hyperodae TaxID=165561 RepID=A0AA39KUR4_MICHY|nr:hypothetical protein PV327_010267 [Microctonus hyperodae]